MDTSATIANPRAFTVTLRSVFAIAVPMTLAHATTPLIGVTDTAVIGQLGSAALLGAVAIGAIMFDFIGTTFNFLRMGTTGLVAQAVGSGDKAAEALTLWRALGLAMVAGLSCILLQGAIASIFVATMGASEAVNDATRAYFSVRVWAMPLMLGNYAILGWLLGLGRARTGLALQIVLGATNIAASLLFVLVLPLGIEGVAGASVLAEGVAFALGLIVMARSGVVRPRLAAVLEARAFRRMLRVNGDILVRSVLLMVAFAFFTAAGAQMGDVVLAANGVLLNLFLLSAYMLDGLATAAEQLGGRAVGARYRPAFDRTVRLTLVAGLLMGAGLSALAIATASPFLALMTTAEEVRAAGAVFVVYAALTPVVGALAFIMDGLFIGATWTAVMRNMMLASTAVFIVLWLALAPTLGNHGLWLALLGYLLVRGLTLWAFVPKMSRETFAVTA